MSARRTASRRSRGRLPGAVAILCLAASTLFAQSIDGLVGRPITRVQLMMHGQPTTEIEIGRVLETQVGKPLSTAEVRESIVHLMAMSRFEDVRVSADPDARGVRLTYDLVPLRSVAGVEFRGIVSLSPRQLRSEVTNRYGNSPPLARAEEMARALEAFYHDHGFLGAAVHPRVEATRRPDQATLIFDVESGSRAAIRGVNVEGAPGGVTAPIVQRLGLQRGASFDPAQLRERVATFTDELRSRGFFEARIESEVGVSDDRTTVDLSIRMSRGPHVTLAFRGDPLPEDRRGEPLAIRREGTIDEDMLENEQRSLEDDLRAQGFRDAEVPYTREARGPDEVEIVFTVKRGPQYKVARVEVTGNAHLSRAALQPLMRLQAGQWFVKARLDADVATVAERYRRDGYKDVKVQPKVTSEPGSQASLVVNLQVAEGQQVLVNEVVFVGNRALDERTLRAAVRLRPNAPFYDPAINADRDAVLLEYLNRGYQLVNVDARTAVTPGAERRATITFVISEGPQIRVDHVLVVGNTRTKTATIDRELGLRRGQPLSLQALAGAQQRLNTLGLFRRVRVTELQRGSETDRDVLVIVEEAAPNTIGYGAGIEAADRPKTDLATGQIVRRVDLAPRGFLEYGRRNLWGKNRSINLFARAAIRTSDQVNEGAVPPSQTDTGSGFREYRLLASYREPRALNSAVDVAFTAVSEQAIRSSFDFNRRQMILEGSHRFTRTVSAAARYSLAQTRLFNTRIDPNDQLDIDRIYNPGVRLSAFSASITRNARDDPADTTTGTLLLLDGTLAARAVGSQVGFMRTMVQGFAYRPLPRSIVLALGARVGLATGFPQVTEKGKTLQDLPASERFFAGGDNSVRGFDQDYLGAANVLSKNGVSNGGNAVLIFNTELRFPLLRKVGLGGAGFVDVGNVYKRVNDMDLGQLRTGLGFGLRWKSPVGPLRLDLGWKATRHRYENGTLEPRFAWQISIGQAF